MQVRPLTVPHCYQVIPRPYGDARGTFLEWYRVEALTEAVGHPLRLAQANCSVSARGVLRGLHYAEGVGHAFLALTEGATVVYLCSAVHDPAREHALDPLDPGLGIAWPLPGGADPVLSERDAAAPTLAEAAERGALPAWADCEALYARLREAG